MVGEVVQLLAVRPGGRYVDATVGGGGHAAAIMEAAGGDCRLLGIDLDPAALAHAGARLAPYGEAVTLVEGNYRHLADICRQHHFPPVQGILLDLGLSSLQLEDAQRGFSFRQEGPLDMRFSPQQRLTARDIVNTYPVDALAALLRRYGEERRSRRIARRLVAHRPIDTTTQLARVVEQAVGWGRDVLHPATRTFQALRIAVNQELDNLEAFLEQACGLLDSGGRLVVISYHSLEDRLVKGFLRREAQDCLCPPEAPLCVCGHRARLRLLTRKALTPGATEVAQNPRSRSAKLRAAERLQGVP